MLWVLIDGTHEAQCVPMAEVERIPAAPEPPTCKCGACMRGRPVGWPKQGGFPWLVRLWAQDWTQPDGSVCPNPECGEKLEVLENAET